MFEKAGKNYISVLMLANFHQLIVHMHRGGWCDVAYFFTKVGRSTLIHKIKFHFIYRRQYESLFNLPEQCRNIACKS